MKNEQSETSIETEKYYSQAWHELESDRKDAGLWARLIVEYEGDEEIVRRKYLQERSEQLRAIDSSERQKWAQENETLSREANEIVDRYCKGNWSELYGRGRTKLMRLYGIKFRWLKFEWEQTRFDKFEEALQFAMKRAPIELYSDPDKPLRDSPTSRTETSLKRTGSSNNYVKRHWSGENSLPWAYWINGVFLSVLLGVATIIIENDSTFSANLWIATAVFLLTIIYSIWAWVGIWRSATTYIDESHRRTPKRSGLWGYLAKAVVIIGIISGLGVALPTIADIISLVKLERSPINTQYYIETPGENDVVLIGYINSRSVSEIKQIFEANGNRRALTLNSPGGILLPAFELADFVIEYDIPVVAAGQCLSSCILVLSASKASFVTPDAELVFHNPEPAAKLISADAIESMDSISDEYYERFIQYGVDSVLLANARDLGEIPLTIGEAYNSNIVDFIWNPETESILNFEEVCENTDCFVVPVQLPAGY